MPLSTPSQLFTLMQMPLFEKFVEAFTINLTWVNTISSILFGFLALVFGLFVGLALRPAALKTLFDPEKGCPYVPSIAKRTSPQNPFAFVGLSHFAVIVPNSIEAVNYYRKLLGFEIQIYPPGHSEYPKPMEFYNLQLPEFFAIAGLDKTGTVDCVWLQHPVIGLTLEIFAYHSPVGEQTFHRRGPNAMGGIGHIALEVLDANKAYHVLRKKAETDPTLEINFMLEDSLKQDGPPDLPAEISLPGGFSGQRVSFFYFTDRYGVQWEFESGRAGNWVVNGGWPVATILDR